MVLHLCMDVLYERLLVRLENVQNLVFRLQVGLHVFHHLVGELVEQCGVVIVVYVVKIHEAADQVVFQSPFRDDGMQPSNVVPAGSEKSRWLYCPPSSSSLHFLHCLRPSLASAPVTRLLFRMLRANSQSSLV